MNIYNYLKKDHSKVIELFDNILSTTSASKRSTLFENLKKELLIHGEAEKGTLYRALKDHKETEELAEKAEEEHEEVKAYLAKLSRLSMEGEKWMEQFGELKHAVTSHIREEEEDIFEKARKILSKEQTDQLAKEMDAAKEQFKEKKL